MKRMTNTEARRQADKMVVLARDPAEWARRPYVRWNVAVVGHEGALDRVTPDALPYGEARAVRRGLVAYWAGVILSGEEVAYV